MGLWVQYLQIVIIFICHLNGHIVEYGLEVFQVLIVSRGFTLVINNYRVTDNLVFFIREDFAGWVVIMLLVVCFMESWLIIMHLEDAAHARAELGFSGHNLFHMHNSLASLMYHSNAISYKIHNLHILPECGISLWLLSEWYCNGNLFNGSISPRRSLNFPWLHFLFEMAASRDLCYNNVYLFSEIRMKSIIFYQLLLRYLKGFFERSKPQNWYNYVYVLFESIVSTASLVFPRRQY